MQNKNGYLAREKLRITLLEAEAPFDATAQPRGTTSKKVWRILRDPVTHYALPHQAGLRTVNPLVWTTIPCQRIKQEPILFIRQESVLVPVRFSVLWDLYLTDLQRAILWLSVSGKNERRIAGILAGDEKAMRRSLEEIGADAPQAAAVSLASKELVHA